MLSAVFIASTIIVYVHEHTHITGIKYISKLKRYTQLYINTIPSIVVHMIYNIYICVYV